jgi:Holliday junction resolvasome RuvABC endonuclease subunit
MFQQARRVMGVDPGLAEMGAVVLEQVGFQKPLVLAAKLIKTEKAKKKERSHLRVSADDQRRYSEMWAALSELADTYQVVGVGVEIYDAWKMTANAVKVACVYGMVTGFGFARGIVVSPWRPQDLKRVIAGKLSASKEEVQDALAEKVVGLNDRLLDFAKGYHEHLADAAGHAYLTLGAMREFQKMIGVPQCP